MEATCNINLTNFAYFRAYLPVRLRAGRFNYERIVVAHGTTKDFITKNKRPLKGQIFPRKP